MKPSRLLPLLCIVALMLPGCLYVHTVQPLTPDMHRTPLSKVEKTGTMSVITVPPVFGGYPLAAWGNDAIGKVAKQEGMTEVYFADMELMIILGIWNEYTIHVYGK